MNVAEAVVKCLEQLGVKRVYGLIGTSILDFVDALRDSKIRYISTRHEQVAVSMADAEGRITGRPGVAAVHAGPGFLNSLISVAAAYKDVSPLLLISGAVKRRLAGLDSWLEVPQRDIIRPLVKGVYRVDKPLEIGKVISEAYSLAASPPQGPVFVEVPEDVWNMSSQAEKCEVKIAPPPTVPKDFVDKVAELLSKSKRPLILAGGGVNNEEGRRLLLDVSERWKIPVAVTGNGRGAYPEDHPLFLGKVGFGGGNIVADRALVEADLVLAVGAGLSDTTTYGYNFVPRGDIVAVNLDPLAEKKPVPYTLYHYADAVDFLKKLAALDLKYEPSVEWFREIEEWKAAWNALLSEALSRSYKGFVNPSKFFHRLNKSLPRDFVMVGGQGMHLVYTFAFITVKAVRGYLAAFNLGAMGFAFPAALGAKVVAPERDVYAVLGDGEFMMTVQDLETAVREKIGVKIIVVNDNAYRVLYARQKAQKMGRIYGTLHTNPDFVKLAEAFGVEAMSISQDEEIEKAVNFITRPTDKPLLLELKIHPDDLPPMNIDGALRF
ncbi:thiamine pyrophosphate-binding protein [Pyrobaculum calidifontis]|uniref:2-oxoacid oxidoreductase (ferredoxin) n=1 Tax=Pyrobaculum calidifontis (strain DSM 21063 / JCM 11548 / VA1) TaxID=410359 RepID=A3MTB7_PYRCJ|nr:thiamine pyrophosphate-binding protein [Pyrobaculum calidifontis]ABO07884.1 acetolactate synthase, large subunit [Pyrobaculum calidifontis JCM 11548]